MELTIAPAEPDVCFSLIIPTFNSADMLPVALQSIRSQSWSKLEVIIVDGGSTDATLVLASQAEDLNVVIISERDKGIYDAINKGVAAATGDLLVVLGSDDALTDGALSAVVDAWLVSARPDIVAGQSIMIGNAGDESIRCDESFDAGALLSGIPFCHNAMYVTRDAYARVGAYDLSYRVCADADWAHRAIRFGCRCVYVPKPLVRFSLGGLSSMRADLTMDETYRIVSGNFPSLARKEVEYLFQAVRGWSDGVLVPAILTRHADDAALMASAALSLSPWAQHVPTRHKGLYRALAGFLLFKQRLMRLWIS